MSFTKKVLNASFFLTISKLFVSATSIISTLILARILTPHDFGIVATAGLVTTLFELLSRLGTEEYLIKCSNPNKNDINTAWTLQLFTKVLISFLIVVFSHSASLFFNDPKLTNVLLVLSLIPLITGFSNVGLILAKKEMQFKDIMKLEIIAKVASFIVTVIFAIVMKNYWAFIIGMLTYFSLYTLLTYQFFEYRPRFSLKSLSKQLSFSQWTLLKGIVNYTSSKIDQILITKFIGGIELGAYSVSQSITSTPVSFLLSPITSAIFPGLGQLTDNKPDFLEKVQKTLFIIVFITLPLSILLILLSSELVSFLLGDAEKWKLVCDILPLVSLFIISSNFNGVAFGILTLLGDVKFLFKLDLYRTVFSIVIYFIALKFGGLIGILVAKLIISYAIMLIILITLRNRITFSIRRLFLSLVPVAICNISVFFIVSYFSQKFIFSSVDFINILLSGSAFVVLLFLTIVISILHYTHNRDWIMIKISLLNLLRFIKIRMFT